MCNGLEPVDRLRTDAVMRLFPLRNAGFNLSHNVQLFWPGAFLSLKSAARLFWQHPQISRFFNYKAVVKMPELIQQFMYAESTRNEAARTPIKTNILPCKLDRILFTVDHHGSHNDTRCESI